MLFRESKACLLWIPWFWRRGTVRDASLHPDPLEKMSIFVLSENIWNQDPRQENRNRGGDFPNQMENIQTF